MKTLVCLEFISLITLVPLSNNIMHLYTLRKCVHLSKNITSLVWTAIVEFIMDSYLIRIVLLLQLADLFHHVSYLVAGISVNVDVFFRRSLLHFFFFKCQYVFSSYLEEMAAYYLIINMNATYNSSRSHKQSSTLPHFAFKVSDRTNPSYHITLSSFKPCP